MSQQKDIGICCFCGQECNPYSQTCGRCARALTGFSLGWNPPPSCLYEAEVGSKKNKDETKEQIPSRKKHRKTHK